MAGVIPLPEAVTEQEDNRNAAVTAWHGWWTTGLALLLGTTTLAAWLFREVCFL